MDFPDLVAETALRAREISLQNQDNLLVSYGVVLNWVCHGPSFQYPDSHFLTFAIARCIKFTRLCGTCYKKAGMTILKILLALFFLFFAPAIGIADEGQTGKESFKEVHEGTKKTVKSVDKKVNKNLKVADKKAKEFWKAANRDAKKTWKKIMQHTKKRTKD